MTNQLTLILCVDRGEIKNRSKRTTFSTKSQLLSTKLSASNVKPSGSSDQTDVSNEDEAEKEKEEEKNSLILSFTRRFSIISSPSIFRSNFNLTSKRIKIEKTEDSVKKKPKGKLKLILPKKLPNRIGLLIFHLLIF